MFYFTFFPPDYISGREKCLKTLYKYCICGEWIAREEKKRDERENRKRGGRGTGGERGKEGQQVESREEEVVVVVTTTTMMMTTTKQQSRCIPDMQLWPSGFFGRNITHGSSEST